VFLLETRHTTLVIIAIPFRVVAVISVPEPDRVRTPESVFYKAFPQLFINETRSADFRIWEIG
jgi:hypothetical protein